MIVRDEQGEVEVGIGDLFQVKAAIFSVICPEFTVSGNPPIWVRLHAGVIDIADGRQVKIEEGKPAPVYLFQAELVASCVREHRLMTFDIPTVPQTPVQKPAKAPGARTSKKRERQNEPIPQTLFD